MKSAGGLGSAVLGAQGMQWAWVSGDEGQAELARSPPLSSEEASVTRRGGSPWWLWGSGALGPCHQAPRLLRIRQCGLMCRREATGAEAQP